MTSTKLCNNVTIRYIYNSRSYLHVIIRISDILVGVINIPKSLLNIFVDISIDFHTCGKKVVTSFLFNLVDYFFKVVVHVSWITIG